MNPQTDFLLLAVLLASGIQLSLGYLPARNLSDSFFVRCTLITSFLWMMVGLSRPSLLSFVILGFTVLSWWNFKRGSIKPAKLFLATSSALGVTFGVVGQGFLHRAAVLPASWDTLTLVGAYILGTVLATTAMILLLGHARTAFDEAPAPMIVTWLKAGLLAQALQLAFVGYAFSQVLGDNPDTALWREAFLPGGTSAMILAGRLLLGLILPVALLAVLLRIATKTNDYRPDLRVLGALAGLVVTGVLFAFRVGF